MKLSSYFEKGLEAPVIPCFWNASDDSDSSQIDNVKIINEKIENIKLDLSDFDAKTRYSDIFLDPERIKKTVKKLEEILRPTDFTSEIIDFINSSVRYMEESCSDAEGKISISSLFSSLAVKMFSDYGIVIVDPAITELKRLSLDLLDFDMDKHGMIKDLIMSAGRVLSSRGYHIQLDPVPDTLDFFLKSKSSRTKVYAKENKWFRVSANDYSKKELGDLVRENTGDVSLNVVLRPLLQDRSLPVLCSVCGPGEVSYFAQLKPVYGMLNMKMPVIYPRFSATVIENRIKKLILGLEIQDSELEYRREDVIKKAIDNDLKDGISMSIKDLENDIEKRITGLEEKFESNKVDISSSFDRIKRNLKKEIEVLRKKIYSGYKKQNEFAVKSIDKIYSNIFPEGNLQEREINIISYLNKYSLGLINDLYDSVKPLDFLHKFLEIN
jgi:bacillithiol biosynthesis cysteine-adding enzyme BshC